jgi:hypothetical protein
VAAIAKNAADLDGFRHPAAQTVIHPTSGVADGRYRRVIAVCDNP